MIASPKDLIYFIELTNTLNFSRASERIGISQPSLSTAIKRLEKAIGVELFIRGKNGVSLTQAGKRLLSHAKQLLQLWDSVRSASIASHHEVQGRYIIGSHPSVALDSLSKFLPDLLLKYPKLDIELKHDMSRKIVEGIINLSIDIGIVVNPIKHPDLIIKKIYDDKVTFWYAKKIKNIEQMIRANNAIIICDPDLMQTQSLLRKIHRDGIKYQRIVKSSSLEVIASLTAHGAGIGILPGSVALSTYPKILKPITSLPQHDDEICYVYRHENRHIKAIQIIVEVIKLHHQSTYFI